MTIISDSLILVSSHLPIILFTVTLIHFARNYLTPGVSSIPGPYLAKITNIWRFIDVAKGHTEVTLHKLHQKHGDYVRLGPNVVSVQNLDALKIIYGINKGYQKTDFYCVQQQLVNGRPTPTLFTTTDENFHASIKRPVSPAYSMSTLTEFEPFVDKTIQTLFGKLDTFVAEEKVCDIAAWLQYYAFDVIGELTFSKPLGFLQQGSDIDGIIVALEHMLDYAGKIGQIPWLDYLFIKNPLKGLFRGGSTGAIARFARARVDERSKKTSKLVDNLPQKDFLTRFLEAKMEHPDIVDDNQVLSYTVSNMNAGSDTTAISLRAILYYTLKSPRVNKKLNQELNLALQEHRISLPVSWKQSQEQLPYLDAVIKEALRLHPAVGLMLERVVPKEGLQLPNGPFLPAGTIVGANPWIIHRHRIFGDDVDSFVPERWLKMDNEPESEFHTRKQKMLRANFTFGAGPRTCIGKNISLLEIYKLFPSIFLNYKIELNDPRAEWELVNAWFVRQKHMDVKLAHAGAKGSDLMNMGRNI